VKIMSEEKTATGPVIVVGVDGSRAGTAALHWALEQATQQHGRVRAVSVRYAPELMPATSFALEPHGTRVAEHDATEHQAWLHELIVVAAAGVDDAAPVEEISLVGDPQTELTKAASGADLLVVGGHGQGPLAEVFLGSVAAGSVRHATCPVVVIPAKLAQQTAKTG
jgi:nucleotide-binding universal stress UspA family protein